MWNCYAIVPCLSAYEGSGGGEIRTHEAFRPSGFQDRRDQPLCHPSRKLLIGDPPSGKATADKSVIGSLIIAAIFHHFTHSIDLRLRIGMAERWSVEKICSTRPYVHVNLKRASEQEVEPCDRRNAAEPGGDSGAWRILEPSESIRKTACRFNRPGRSRRRLRNRGATASRDAILSRRNEKDYYTE